MIDVGEVERRVPEQRHFILLRGPRRAGASDRPHLGEVGGVLRRADRVRRPRVELVVAVKQERARAALAGPDRRAGHRRGELEDAGRSRRSVHGITIEAVSRPSRRALSQGASRGALASALPRPPGASRMPASVLVRAVSRTACWLGTWATDRGRRGRAYRRGTGSRPGSPPAAIQLTAEVRLGDLAEADSHGLR